MINRFKKFFLLLKQVFRVKAFLTFLDFLIYRTPFAYRWSRLCGYDFHKSTIYHSVEEFFPNARKHLEQSGGIGILSYTILNSSLLATAFLTVDRTSQALSIEHTLEVPHFSSADLSH